MVALPHSRLVQPLHHDRPKMTSGRWASVHAGRAGSRRASKEPALHTDNTGWRTSERKNPAIIVGAFPFVLRGAAMRLADYTAISNRIVKVLDFIQLGGPNLTVGSTTFELDMAL